MPWKNSVPRRECQPRGSQDAIKQARDVLEPRWSDAGDHVPIEDWVEEMATHFLAHRKLEQAAPRRSDTKQDLRDLADKAEALRKQVQALDGIALELLAKESRIDLRVVWYPLKDQEEVKQACPSWSLDRPCAGSRRPLLSTLKVLANSARACTDNAALEGKDGRRNSFSTTHGTADRQLIVRCAEVLRDLGLKVAGTTDSSSGAHLFRLAHAVMWYATGDQGEVPPERALKNVAASFAKIEKLERDYEAAQSCEESDAIADQLRARRAELERL